MTDIGDKIKFVSVEEYVENTKKSGKDINDIDMQIQQMIAGKTDIIKWVETLYGPGKELYYTSKKHISKGNYFHHERFKKVGSSYLDLSEDLFQL